jgi:hypothetical protein
MKNIIKHFQELKELETNYNTQKTGYSSSNKFR